MTAKIAEIDGVEHIIGIIEAISERKANEQELETQNERLEEFVNVLSHDLRNPLEIAIVAQAMALSILNAVATLWQR